MKKRHDNDLQEKGQAYVEVDEAEAPQHRDTGEFFLKRYREIDPTARIIERTPEQAIRINTLRTTADALIAKLNSRAAFLKKIEFLKHGYFTQSSFSMGSTPEYLLGHYYIQAPLSQLAVEVLDPKPGSKVLDMASAPGGKTTYLATLVKGGMVIALDNDAMRLASVRNNVERMGLTNVVCVKKDARFANDLKTTFPYVLLDAPCSGNFCSEDSWFGKRTMQDIKNNARTQRELIRAAYLCLEPGGRMVYSTCSLEPEEDELIIDWAIKKFPGLKVIPLNLPMGDHGATHWEGHDMDPSVAGTRRFWPHKTGMEGFYIALLER